MSSSKATTHAVRRAALSTVESLETRRLMAHVPELVDATPENFEQWGQFTAAKGNFVLVGNSVQMVNSLANVGEVTLFDTSDADPVAGAVTIANPDPDANDGFGAAVAFIGSDKIAISSFEPNNAGKVFIYDLQGTKLHEINSPFGPSSTWGTQLASWENGTDDYLLVGGPIDGTTESNGSIRVFNADTGAYTGLEINNDDTPMPGLEFDGFGSRMAVSGNTLVVSANAFDFNDPTNTTSLVFQFQLAPGASPTASHVRTYSEQSVSPAHDSNDAGFGTFAIALDGDDLFIGENTDNENDPDFDRNEFVHHFDTTDGSFVHTYAFEETPGDDISFGNAITVSDGKLAIGAAGYNLVGAVFSYDIASATLIEQIGNPHPETDGPGSQFGYVLASLDGGRIVVNDLSRDVGAVDAAGVLYLYELADLATSPTEPTAEQDASGNLLVIGTAAPESIEIRTAGATGVGVYVDGELLGSFTLGTGDTITVYGGDEAEAAGGDTITVGGDVLFDANLFGEAGTDSIVGGGGHDFIDGGADDDHLTSRNASDVLLGGLGDDTLLGGNGRDLLIGGDGSDSIAGDNSEDILIAGGTVHDGNRAALDSIQAIWNGGGSRNDRVTILGDDLLHDSKILHDNDIDYLIGGNGTDYFLPDVWSEVLDETLKEVP